MAYAYKYELVCIIAIASSMHTLVHYILLVAYLPAARASLSYQPSKTCSAPPNFTLHFQTYIHNIYYTHQLFLSQQYY